ncbi:hypothetical protein [Paenibacillus sp. FSL K6-1230]|uniref:hypothetical protein n=1 Tax=Paenibacillus sp. FSL K6-1230 TaxID=2921603 RepID=UPI0030FAA7BD
MELSRATSALAKLNEEKFCRAFMKLFDKTFHINDLNFWCELTGISTKTAWEILRKKEWKRLDEIYVRGTIGTMKELAELCTFHSLQKKDIIKAVVSVLKMRKGYLPGALKQLPLSFDIIHILLELQDELVPVTRLYWFPKYVLPDQLRVISRYAHSQRSQWDELIISTFIKSAKPLRLEELIYQSMGIIPAPVALKRLYSFMLNLLPVSKVDDTEYWILTEWKSKVDLLFVNNIAAQLTGQVTLPLVGIMKNLTDYEESKVIELLEFWPEFTKHSDGNYGLNIHPLDDEVLAILVPSLLKNLEDSNDGIPTTQLFKHAEILANSHGLNIHAREFKQFLKGWGEVAIVGGRIYAMQEAPFHRMRLGDVAYLVLKENGAPMPYTELEAEVRERRNYSNSISSVFLTEPKMSRPSRGYWALREWGMIEYDPQIHDRIGEVLVSIIEQAGRPVHKKEIRSQLRRRGMNMSEVTLHIDLSENERIHQVARGVYALMEWNLTFRDLFRFNFPFRLSLPDGNPTIYELEHGVMIEYFITKSCLELGRILVKRYINEFFSDLQQYSKYTVTDSTGNIYEGWVDTMADGRFQFLGLQRWYKTHKPRYGENIYLYIPYGNACAFTLLTTEQADEWMN